MKDDDTFPSDEAWSDERIEAAYQERQDDEDGKSDFAKRVEEIRERRERDDETDESSDHSPAVERLVGRAYRVRYNDPETGERERKFVVADDIQPTAAGMAFTKNDGESVAVYPAPVEIDRLDADEIAAKREHYERMAGVMQPLADAANRILGND